MHPLRLILAALALAVPALAQTSSGYDQPYRPQVHFSPQHNWTNDPNGLVFFRGEYHLFYQYNPSGDVWGHMSWGHAVSSDLLHWKELPVAIPEKDGVMIFTGSIVIDHNNRSGLCKPNPECMVAVYTGYSGYDHPGAKTLQTQNIASSQDNGRTWTPYDRNPVLDLHMEDFRDPSVSWDDSAKHWVMAVSLPKQHKVRFYSSPDLKQWTQLSDFGPAGTVAGDWECPDLLRVPAASGTGSIWALKVGLNPGGLQGGSGEQYFLGSFDGKAFTQSSSPGAQGWTNYGKDDYCAISFNGLAKTQKPLLLGWMSNWQYAAKLPTSPWRGQMSLARQLTFLKDSSGLALRQQPVTAPLRGTAQPITGANKVLATPTTPYELNLTFTPTSKAEPIFGLRIFSDDTHFTEIAFDRAKNQFYIDRTKSSRDIAPDFPAHTAAPLTLTRPYDLKLIVDRSSVEAFAQDGTIAMTDLIFPLTPTSRIEAFTATGKTIPIKGTLYPLHSIWK